MESLRERSRKLGEAAAEEEEASPTVRFPNSECPKDALRLWGKKSNTFTSLISVTDFPLLCPHPWTLCDSYIPRRKLTNETGNVSRDGRLEACSSRINVNLINGHGGGQIHFGVIDGVVSSDEPWILTEQTLLLKVHITIAIRQEK